MRIFRHVMVLIISSIIYLISPIESFSEERIQLTLNLGENYFKKLYMSEVAMLQKELEVIDKLEKTMIGIEYSGYTDLTNQDIKNLSKGTIIVTDLILKYLRSSIPLDGDLSELVDDLSLKYYKPFDRITSCDIIEYVYYLKYDAGIIKVNKKTFIDNHKTKCKKFDEELVDILSLYAHAWIKKIPTSQELTDISDRYDKFLNSMLRYLAYVYSLDLNTATAIQMKILATERQNIIKIALDKKVKKLIKAEENLDRYF